MAAIANACWLATSSVPKIVLKAAPGGIVGHGAVLDLGPQLPGADRGDGGGGAFRPGIRRTRWAGHRRVDGNVG